MKKRKHACFKITPSPDVLPSADFLPPSGTLGPELEMKIIKNFCNNLALPSFEEAGCAVCGQLTLCHDLLPLKSIKNMLHVLEAPGITCIEHKTEAKKICEYNSPVLDHGCNYMVCTKC